MRLQLGFVPLSGENLGKFLEEGGELVVRGSLKINYNPEPRPPKVGKPDQLPSPEERIEHWSALLLASGFPDSRA